MVYWESTKKKIAIRRSTPCLLQLLNMFMIITRTFPGYDQSTCHLDKTVRTCRMTKTFLENMVHPYESIDWRG